MRHNTAINSVGFDFLDGYLMAALREELDASGEDKSGLYNFYASRVQQRYGGLADYEATIARYVLDNCQGQRIVEVGCGLGELPILLALNGLTTAGVESDGVRVEAAHRLRRGLTTCFPELAERYEIIGGLFPEDMPAKFTGPGVTLIFTNVGAGWDDARLERAISYFHQVGDVILDLRLFGIERNQEGERQLLFDRIASVARRAELLPDPPFFARFTFLR